MSAIQPGAFPAEGSFERDPLLYACPECGASPRACLCLRRSVRDRIADAIHFPFERNRPSPFLLLHGQPLEPPAEDLGPRAG